MTNPNGKPSTPAILNGMAGIPDQATETRAQFRPVSAVFGWTAAFLDLVTRLSTVLSGLALAAILFLTLNEVTLRYFFNAPTTWSNDVNQWFFAVAVMLIIPEITRTNGHIAISVLVDRLPHAKKSIACRLIALLSFLMCLGAFYISGIETLRQCDSGIMTMWVRPIPKWWISSVIPFGFLLSALQFLRLGMMPSREKEE